MKKIPNLNRKTIFRISAFLVVAALVVVFFPRGKSGFKYRYAENKPWGYTTLAAPFDFPLYKSDVQVEKERAQHMESFYPYFRFVPGQQQKILVVSYNDYEWLENNYYIDLPEIKEVCIAIDPAVGSKRRNDYSAIVAVAKGQDGYFYVLEADLQKRRPEQIIEDAKMIIARYYTYNPKIVCETNQMQLFFSSTLQRELVQAGIYLDWIDICHAGGDSKAMRIESLVPHVRQGHIKFKQGQRILLSQLRNYPKGHDDGPDCLEMAMKPMLDAAVAQFSFGGINTGNVTAGRNGKNTTPFNYFKR